MMHWELQLSTIMRFNEVGGKSISIFPLRMALVINRFARFMRKYEAIRKYCLPITFIPPAHIVAIQQWSETIGWQEIHSFPW